jgi:alpha-tubulin suppressor-like RCC1 family protein
MSTVYHAFFAGAGAGSRRWNLVSPFPSRGRYPMILRGFGTGTLLRVAGVPYLCLLLFASCSGDASGPEVGGGGPEDYPTPTIVSTSVAFTSIAASGHHTCAISRDGLAYCWGANEHGELGTSAAMETCSDPLRGTFPCSGVPLPVSGGVRFVSITAGGPGAGRSCALTAQGKAYCWGFGLGGQLGDGTRTNRPTPTPVAGDLEFEVLHLGLGMLSCGIARDGDAYCWGLNTRGQLGNGVMDSVEPTPTRITGELRFASLDVGEYHACGLTAEGRAYCWGGNWYGTLGVGSAGGSGGLAQSAVPLPVVGDPRFRKIVTGSNQTCGLTEAGAAYCWGASFSIGSATTAPDVGTPQPVAGGHRFESLHAGFLHTCGRTTTGEVYCWGQNFGGELGDGSRTDRQTPVRVNTEVRFASLAPRPYCGLATDERAYCWGSNPYGQVGRRGSRAGR